MKVPDRGSKTFYNIEILWYISAEYNLELSELRKMTALSTKSASISWTANIPT